MLLGLRSAYEMMPPGSNTTVSPTIRSTSKGSDTAPQTVDPAVAVITKPAGLTVGDYLLAWVTGSADISSFSAPSGFAVLATQAANQANNIPAATLYGKVATASDVSAASFTFQGTAFSSSTAGITVILSAITAGTYDTTTPVSIGTWTTVVRGTAGTGQTSQTVASMTGVAQGMFLALFASDANNNSQTYPSTTSTNSMSLVDQIWLGYAFEAVYQKILSTGGATGSVTVTPTGTNTSNGQSTLGAVINPAVTQTAMAPNAGADASVVVNTAFNRTGTFTAAPTSYAWKVSSGPDQVGNVLSTTAAVSFTPTSVGTYVLTFFTTNANGTAYDQVTVTSTLPPPPTVNGGADAQVTINTPFTRTATESGQSITSRAWTITSGPANVGDTIGTAAALNWTPTSVGTYVLTYSATNTGGTGSDTITVTVVPPRQQLDITVLGTGTTGTSGTVAGQVSLGYQTTNAMAIGDIVYAYINVKPASATVTTPAGWSLVGSYASTDTTAQGIGTGPTRLWIFRTILSAVPASTDTVTFALSPNPANSSMIGYTRTFRATLPTGGSDLQFEDSILGGYSVNTAGTNVGGTATGIAADSIRAKDRITLTFGFTTALTSGQASMPTIPTAAITGVNFSGAFAAARNYTSTTAGDDCSIAQFEAAVASGPNTGTSLAVTASVAASVNNAVFLSHRYRATYLPPNTPMPVVNAGADASAVVGVAFTRTATENGSPFAREWTILSGPTGVGDTIGTAAALSWTPTLAGVYVLRYSATNEGGTGSDDVQVTVTLPAPVADAGVDATVVINNAFTRTGTATNSPTSYAWTIVSGPAGVTAGTNIGNAAALSYTPTILGTYTLRLTATNATGSGTDDLVLTVNPPAPVVDAGVDATILVNTAFNRTAIEANSPTSRAWTIVSGPTGVGSTLATTAALSWTPTTLGTYTLRYSATNVTGTGTDDVIVTVNPPAPVADAGVDATIVVNTAFNRTGTATNSPTSYSWTIVSGPAGVTAGTVIGSAAALSYTPTLVGSYTLRLTATNVTGSGTDDLVLTVNAPTPVVDAGVDATIVQNGTFNRTATETNSPTSRAWTITSGPAGVTAGTVLSTTAALSYVPTIVGTYVLRYTATNASGTAFDELTLIVTQSPPTVDVGADASIAVGNTFTRGASTTQSPDTFAWTIQSGPTGVGSTIGTTATLSYAPTTIGTYVIRLTVSNSGGSAFDELNLTVTYAAPTVDAGVDAAINLGSTFTRTATENLQSAPVTSRQWSIVSGPAGVTAGNIAGQTAAALSYTPSVAGTYVLRYTLVTSGGTATDDVQLTVTLQPPTANAGADASSLVNTAFTRTATETGVNITSRAWTVVGGPTGVGSTIGTAAALSYTPTQAGVYTLRYTVTNAAGSAFDEMILTVNGPPIVDAGADATIVNRTALTRNATETGGGGVTARSWTITAGPNNGTVIGSTSTLSWTPTLPGTYTITYSATNPFGTGTDTLVVTVTAITITVSGTSQAVSDNPNATLARRARITVAGTSLAVTDTIAQSFVRIRRVLSSSQSDSTTLGGKPKVITRLAKTEQATSSITGSLATRKLLSLASVEQSTSTTTGTIRVVGKVRSTSTETTPTVTSKLVTARQSTGYSQALSSQPPAVLSLARKLASTSLSDSTATLRLNRRGSISATSLAESSVPKAALGVRPPGAARAAAHHTATGTLIAARRIRSTSTETTPPGGQKLSRAVRILATAGIKPSTSRRLNSTIREQQTVVQAGSDYTVRLRLSTPLLYDGMIGVGRVYFAGDVGGALRQLSGTAREISSNPNVRANRVTRHSRLDQATSLVVVKKFYRIGKMAALSLAGNTAPAVKLGRLRVLLAARLQAASSNPPPRIRNIRVYFRHVEERTNTSRRLFLQTRFRQIIVRADSRLSERSGFAVLTTAKGVTSSPKHLTRQSRVLQGYVTAQTDMIGNLGVQPKREYTQAKASIVAPVLRRRARIRAVSQAEAFAFAKKPRKAGKLSTIIRVFEGAELDAYIEQENYTGSAQSVAAAPPPETPVFTRAFMRPR